MRIPHIPKILSVHSTVFILLLFLSCHHQTDVAEFKNLPENKSAQDTITAMPYFNIQLIPLGYFDNELAVYLKEETEKIYNCSIELHEGYELPEMAWYEGRQRYRADSLLIFLSKIRMERTHIIVGLTSEDISCTTETYDDWGIFGFGYMPGDASVVSTFRLGRNNAGKGLLYERTLKILLHEIGHNTGLEHCNDSDCLMADYDGSIRSMDQTGLVFCDNCRMRSENWLKQP
jgi:archaemetzincin